MSAPAFAASDTFKEAWAKDQAANPDTLSSWRKVNGHWPEGHPNGEDE